MPALVGHLAGLQGRDETGEISERERGVLRLLTPLAKLYTAKTAVNGISEVLECFGGAGYVENTGLPVLLRDAQVLPIWEGTTNVLSLDALRAIERDGALEPWFVELEKRLATVTTPPLSTLAAKVWQDAQTLYAYAASWQEKGREYAEAGARNPPQQRHTV